MKKVLIIGDSHVAALYRVYKEVESTLDIRFISAAGSVYRYIEIVDGKINLLPLPKITPETPTSLEKEFYTRYELLKRMFHQQLGTRTSIELNEFDHCVLYGQNLLSPQNFKWWELTNQSTKYSHALLLDMLKEKVLQKNTNQVAVRRMKGLNSYAILGGNVYVLLNPYINEKGFVNNHDSNIDISILQSIPVGAKIVELFPIYRKLFESQMMKFISPPSALYSGDSRAVSAEYKSESLPDFVHLNLKGALLTLNKIVNDVNCEDARNKD
ncbi:MAG: hypothetical protein ACI83B_001641 [Sediminicola sp.]|jgi:hypothetical protein